MLFLLEARFLAKKFGLAGKDELEQAFADMYADQLTDLLTELAKPHWEKDEHKKKELTDKLHNETVPNMMKLFEKRLTENHGHFAGSGITYTDVNTGRFLVAECCKQLTFFSRSSST